ncbi:putative phospholipase [Elsinoe ampelina]|uniref:Putative phospholipase n=1 Tax=Elsinoe ampelina TaxID=302913 RepID=A0A6A6GK70_9PEZI|nr:putative phospholipase [Elsinoe ampelina]
MTNNTTTIADHLITLLDNYNALNTSIIDELHEEPSPLEFMRHVALNRPFVIRSGASSWPATQKWTAEYLTSTMCATPVQVATTPFGNADAIVEIADTSSTCNQADASVEKPDTASEPSNSPPSMIPEPLFVEPHISHLPFASTLSYITSQSLSPSGPASVGPVKYLQTQNDNLRDEYAPLFADVPSSIPFARIALQKDPDAVNFWLGNERSVTALHKDNYQNVYAQIRGRKRFVLLPPVAAPAVGERDVGRGRYEEDEGGELGLKVVAVEGEERVPVPTWDPLREEVPGNVFGEHVKPMRVTLEEGDMMYLPAMWYHHVSQDVGEEGFSCSVNYWYDMEFAGQFWSTNSLIRDLSMAVTEQSS